MFIIALGPTNPTPSLTKLRPKVNGCPIKVIEYRAVSVQTKVSCFARIAPIIEDPAESLKDPAVLVAKGSHSTAFS